MTPGRAGTVSTTEAVPQTGTSTADDTLRRKSGEANRLRGPTGGQGPEGEGVDTIFTLCGGHIIDICGRQSPESITVGCAGLTAAWRCAPPRNPAAKPTAEHREEPARSHGNTTVTRRARRRDCHT
jgi:hypothetical protein